MRRKRSNMNPFYPWGAILGPFATGLTYDRTESYALVFSGITVALIISAALTALLFRTITIPLIMSPVASRGQVFTLDSAMGFS